MHRIIIALAVTSSVLLWQADRNLPPEPLRVVLSSFAGEPTAKEGAGFDPDGLTATAPVTDEAAGGDPNG